MHQARRGLSRGMHKKEGASSRSCLFRGLPRPTCKHKSGRSAPRGASFAEPFARFQSGSFGTDDTCYDAKSMITQLLLRESFRRLRVQSAPVLCHTRKSFRTIASESQEFSERGSTGEHSLRAVRPGGRRGLSPVARRRRLRAKGAPAVRPGQRRHVGRRSDGRGFQSVALSSALSSGRRAWHGPWWVEDPYDQYWGNSDSGVPLDTTSMSPESGSTLYSHSIPSCSYA